MDLLVYLAIDLVFIIVLMFIVDLAHLILLIGLILGGLNLINFADIFLFSSVFRSWTAWSLSSEASGTLLEGCSGNMATLEDQRELTSRATDLTTVPMVTTVNINKLSS